MPQSRSAGPLITVTPCSFNSARTASLTRAGRNLTRCEFASVRQQVVPVRRWLVSGCHPPHGAVQAAPGDQITGGVGVDVAGAVIGGKNMIELLAAAALVPWAHPLAFRPLAGWRAGASGNVPSLYGPPVLLERRGRRRRG
jgi:hypothetical protein